MRDPVLKIAATPAIHQVGASALSANREGNHRWPTDDGLHHLYVCPPGSKAFQEHLPFRDYLRTHPEDAMACADLKRVLALQFRNDRPAYVAGKAHLWPQSSAER